MKLFFPILILICARVLAQSGSTEVDGSPLENVRQLTVDLNLYKETIEVLDSGLNYIKSVPRRGQCGDSTFRKLRFQTRVDLVDNRFWIEDKFLVFKMGVEGGAVACQDLKLIWDGKMQYDKRGNRVANVVISFKNIDNHRVLRFQEVAFDLSTFPIKPREKILLVIYNFNDSIEFQMPDDR